MEKLKFALLAIVVLSVLGFLGYWSVVTLQSGTDHIKDQKIKQLTEENEALQKEVKDLKSELALLQSKLEKAEPVPEANPEPEPAPHKYQSLIDELQTLASRNVLLKEKSRGASVGTMQKFLNIYNNTSGGVDNDYGSNTAKAIADFQKASGLTADGQAGAGTFNKMIEWLKGQG